MKRRMVDGSDSFRAELVKLMPGYSWTVHQSFSESRIEATGTQSSGFNRLSTLSVVRTAHGTGIAYEVKSAGYGLRAKWLHSNTDGTLARALRGLQEHYEHQATTYQSHAAALQRGRRATGVPTQNTDPAGRADWVGKPGAPLHHESPSGGKGEAAGATRQAGETPVTTARGVTAKENDRG